jgi:hypothetical protein
MRQTGNDEPGETGHAKGYVPGCGASITCTVTETLLLGRVVEIGDANPDAPNLPAE